jgi:hypothetical protein
MLRKQKRSNLRLLVVIALAVVCILAVLVAFRLMR